VTQQTAQVEHSRAELDRQRADLETANGAAADAVAQLQSPEEVSALYLRAQNAYEQLHPLALKLRREELELEDLTCMCRLGSSIPALQAGKAGV
jgi:hypothetical protein